MFNVFFMFLLQLFLFLYQFFIQSLGIFQRLLKFFELVPQLLHFFGLTWIELLLWLEISSIVS